MQSKKPILVLACLLIIVACTTERVHGASLFQTAQTFPTNAKTPLSIAVGDMNGDGKPDVIAFNLCTATNCNGTVSILLGNGDGTLQEAKTFDSGLTFANAIAVADLNGDSKPDVIAMSGASCGTPECLSYFSVMFGNGDGTIGQWHKYSTGGYESLTLGLADLNQDGKVDLVIGSHCNGPSCDGSAVSVILGRGDGSFQPAEVFATGDVQLVSTTTSDVNGDGKIDVLVAHNFGTVGIFLGNGDGTLQTAELISTGTDPTFVMAEDLNHDGKPDIIIGTTLASASHEQVGVLLGNGDGSFQPVQCFDTNAPSSFGKISLVAGDVNGDGKLDIIAAVHCPASCDNTPVIVLLGNGDGTLQKAQRYYSGGRNSDGIALTDFNGDSKPDIAVINECVNLSDCDTGTVGILLGTSGVQTTTTVTSSLNPSAYGQSVTLTASVASVGKSAPTGTVKFLNGSTSIGTVTLIDGVASTTKTNLPAGSLAITAMYNGDSNSAKSTSSALIQVVNQASTTTTVSSSLNPSNQGQSVTFTATITSATTKPAGSVTFTSGGQTLGTITVSGGKAKFTTSTLSVGSHKVTATYNGTANINSSKGSVTQVVN